MTSQALCSTELDRKFGEKLQTILEKQLDNPEFTIEDFASAVGVSRAAFFRKVKGVTGYTPNEYMRILRMKRAMELLQEGIYNVSEIAYKVGMNDPLYFSKCFKSHFGAPPSAYLHKKIIKERLKDYNVFLFLMDLYHKKVTSTINARKMVIISDWYVIGSTQISWKAFHLPITSTKVQNTTTVAIEKRRAYPH